jgi:hypothetical protein
VSIVYKKRDYILQADKSQYSLKRKEVPATDSMQAEKSQHSLKKKKRSVEKHDSIGKRLRGPSGRTPAPTFKADYFYPGKDSTRKSHSEANAQSNQQRSQTHWSVDEFETMSERDRRRQMEGRVHIQPVREREGMQEFLDWVNTTPELTKMITIDNLTITQRQLAVLTNPYLDDRDKYLGDEVNVVHSIY